MSDTTNPANERRKFLKLLGGSAALIPVIGLSACGKEQAAPMAKAEPAKPAAQPKTQQPTAPKPAPQTNPGSMQASMPSGDDLPKVSPDDPQAKALGYVHDATTVDKATQTRYEAGQACKNCALYTGGDKPWGGCGIFVGKAVNANGWCSAYAPKPA